MLVIDDVLCLCYILFNNAIPSIIVSNVHSVLGDVGVHTDVVTVHRRVRRFPANS